MKYIGALHSYIHHTLLLCNPTDLDEVCVQATHLESRGNNVQEDHTKKPSKFQNNKFKGNRKGKRQSKQRKRKENPLALIGKKMGTMMSIVGRYI